MTNANFIKLAVSEVNKYVLNHLDKSDDTPDFDTYLFTSDTASLIKFAFVIIFYLQNYVKVI